MWLFCSYFVTILWLFCSYFVTILWLFCAFLWLFCGYFVAILWLFCGYFVAVLWLFCSYFVTILKLISPYDYSNCFNVQSTTASVPQVKVFANPLLNICALDDNGPHCSLYKSWFMSSAAPNFNKDFLKIDFCRKNREFLTLF